MFKYSKNSQCPLPLVSITSVLQNAKISAYLQLRQSKDVLVSSLRPKIKAGRHDIVEETQCHWTRWTEYIQNDLSWNKLSKMPLNLISFCVNATYDTLPSPSNLRRWKISDEAACFLCKKNICTTAHVLGACKVALKQQRILLFVSAVFLRHFSEASHDRSDTKKQRTRQQQQQ